MPSENGQDTWLRGLAAMVANQMYGPNPQYFGMSPAYGAFDPEGSGYDYNSAILAGLSPGETGHWPSRVPNGPFEGLLLKGRGHETWYKTVEAEKKLGYEIYKDQGRYWSRKVRKKRSK